MIVIRLLMRHHLRHEQHHERLHYPHSPAVAYHLRHLQLIHLLVNRLVSFMGLMMYNLVIPITVTSCGG